MKRWFFIFICLFALYKFFSAPSSSVTPGEIVHQDPEQTEISKVTSFNKNGYLIHPLASFDITGRILSTHDYPPNSDKEADLAPVDFAFGWGPMSDTAILNKIEISQGNRFYYWHVEEFPIPRKEIETHSANMHLIPATEEIKEQLEDVHPGQIVHIKGYLVEVHGDNGYIWRSSLTREDTGFGACEVIWVTYAAIN